MLKSKKHVFWEALLVTLIVFILGLLIGFAFEASRLDRMDDYYAQSEISLIDVLAMNDLIKTKGIDCDDLVDFNFKLADRIYNEALLLETYEASGKISDSITMAHRKYDTLRTFLWINSMKTLDKCPNNVSIVVYLYEYKPDDLAKKATQNVWSKILFDLKQKNGDKVLLIPIAVGNDISSLNILIEKFGVSSFPAVIINNKNIVYELKSVEELEKYLK